MTEYKEVVHCVVDIGLATLDLNRDRLSRDQYFVQAASRICRSTVDFLTKKLPFSPIIRFVKGVVDFFYGSELYDAIGKSVVQNVYAVCERMGIKL